MLLWELQQFLHTPSQSRTSGDYRSPKTVTVWTNAPASGVARIGVTADGKTILEVAGRPAFELNGVAATIWAKLVAGFSPEKIKSQLIAEYGAPNNLSRAISKDS